MSLFARSLFMLAVLFVAAGGVVCADVLTLANGDKLKGTLIKNVDGLITFKSDILGEIVIATTKASVEVDLTPEQKAALAKAEEEKKKAAEVAAAKQPVDKTKASFSAIDFRDLRNTAKTTSRTTKLEDTGWVNKIEFGLTSQRGRADKLDLTLYTQNNRRTPRTETRFLNSYIYSETDDNLSADSLTSNLRFRYALTQSQKVFFQSNSRYTRDRYALVNADMEQGVGLGSNLVAHKMIVVSAGAEVALRYRSYMDQTPGKPDETATVFNVFQDLTLTINPRFTFTQDFVALVNPSDSTDQKYNFNAVLTGKITRALNINTRVEIEYDGHRVTLPRDLRYNQRIATTLGYIF